MPTVGQQLQAFDTRHPSGVKTLQLRPPGGGAGSPELGYLQSTARNAPPVQGQLQTPLRANESLLSTSENGSVADLTGRARVAQMLDAAYGTDAELAPPDPRDVALENAKKDTALESFQVVPQGQQLPIRGREAQQRRALQFEAEQAGAQGSAMQKELDTLDRENVGPGAGLEDQKLAAVISRELAVRPEFQKMAPEQKNAALYAAIIEAKKRHQAMRRRNVLMKYELATTGQVTPQPE